MIDARNNRLESFGRGHDGEGGGDQAIGKKKRRRGDSDRGREDDRRLSLERFLRLQERDEGKNTALTLVVGPGNKEKIFDADDQE